MLLNVISSLEVLPLTFQLAQDMQHTRRLRMAVKASQDSVSSVDSQDEDTIKELLERLPERDTEPWVLDSVSRLTL